MSDGDDSPGPKGDDTMKDSGGSSNHFSRLQVDSVVSSPRTPDTGSTGDNVSGVSFPLPAPDKPAAIFPTETDSEHSLSDDEFRFFPDSSLGTSGPPLHAKFGSQQEGTAAYAIKDAVANKAYLASASISRRDHVIAEVLKTERAYIENLDVLVMTYLIPLRDGAHSKSLNITPREVSYMFGSIEVILNVNRELLVALEERYERWSPTQLVGDIFLQFAPHFKMYTQYCNNYDTAVATLARVRERPDIASFLKSVQESKEMAHAELASYLIMPIQRIPRYVLLLRDLHSHTSPHHPDFENLSRSISNFEAVTEHVDSSIKRAENITKMITLQSRFKAGRVPVQLVKPSRRFVREGKLHKVTSRFIKECWFILFNDILIYAYEIVGALIYKGTIDMGTSWIRDLEDSEALRNSFQIVGRSKTYTVYAGTLGEKRLWIDSLQGVIDNIVARKPHLLEHRQPVKVRNRKASGIWKRLTYHPHQFDPSNAHTYKSVRGSGGSKQLGERAPLLAENSRIQTEAGGVYKGEETISLWSYLPCCWCCLDPTIFDE